MAPVSCHLDLIFKIADIQRGVHHIQGMFDHIERRGEQFDLLRAWYSRQQKDHARMHFQTPIPPTKLDGVVGNENPILLRHNAEDVPILGLIEAAVVDVRRLKSARVSGLRQHDRKVLVHKEAQMPQTLRLGISSVANGIELRHEGLRGRPLRGCACAKMRAASIIPTVRLG